MTIYIYNNPFVLDKKYRSEDYLLDYLDENDREDEINIRNLLLKFAVQEKLLVRSDNEVYLDPGKNIGEWRWAMVNTNFRSLVDPKEYSRLLSSVTLDEGLFVNKILDLHVRIGSSFNVKLINTIINRVMSSISTIPYNLSEGTEGLEWTDIHKEVPFIWLLIYLQNVIRNEATKVIGE
jgi:hypothetical protein